MKKLFILPLAATVAFASCTKEEETPTPQEETLNVPSTYAFERNGATSVDYSGQTERLDMMAEMMTYVKSGNSLGTVLDGNKVQDMYANANNPFSTAFGKQLKDKTNPNTVSFYEGLFAEAATASQNASNATPGTAGVLNEEYPNAGTSASAGYLVNENGLEYAQVIEKGLMGDVFYYQASEVYLSKERMNDDWLNNDGVAEGKNYTNMEHYFDEAFGYFGVTPEFTDGRYWGKYCSSRNGDADEFGMANVNSQMSEAFRTARAAIVAKDLDARNTAIKTILNTWEAVAGNTAANYLSEAIADVDANEMHKKAHHLSEAVGFMLALQTRGSVSNGKYGRISDQTAVNEALAIVGVNTNFYTITKEDIAAAQAKLVAAFPGGEVQ